MRKRDYRDYMQDISDSVADIISFIEGMTFEEFIKDKKTINAVVRSIEVIGEATKKIPETLKNKYSEIPWKKMAGMREIIMSEANDYTRIRQRRFRSKMIHEYFGIDMEILWKTAKDEIPPLRLLIQNALKNLGE